MTRPTVKKLIEEDLGYCCEWFFFQLYRRTAVVADRLGVTTRAVKYHKAACRNGKCSGKPNCLLARAGGGAQPQSQQCPPQPSAAPDDTGNGQTD